MYTAHTAIVSLLAVGMISMSAAPRRPECDRQAFFVQEALCHSMPQRVLCRRFHIPNCIPADSDGGLNGTYESATPVSVKLEQKDWIFDLSQYQAVVSCSYSSFLVMFVNIRHPFV